MAKVSGLAQAVGQRLGELEGKARVGQFYRLDFHRRFSIPLDSLHTLAADPREVCLAHPPCCRLCQKQACGCLCPSLRRRKTARTRPAIRRRPCPTSRARSAPGSFRRRTVERRTGQTCRRKNRRSAGSGCWPSTHGGIAPPRGSVWHQIRPEATFSGLRPFFHSFVHAKLAGCP